MLKQIKLNKLISSLASYYWLQKASGGSSLRNPVERSRVSVTGSGEAGSGPQAAKTIMWLLLGVRSRPSANDNNSLIVQARGRE
ncbi:hypothetical protein ILYODFUR_018318 [Ilyodon furcidens]|uniref:Uncharacterized protein n=1 Tax=Ilyodon furcidens TaxID=33524 RepID=A0ABV0SY39_9TELE